MGNAHQASEDAARRPALAPEYDSVRRDFDLGLALGGMSISWTHPNQDYTARSSLEPRYPARCYQLSQYGSGRDVYADGVGKPCWTGAVGSVA